MPSIPRPHGTPWGDASRILFLNQQAPLHSPVTRETDQPEPKDASSSGRGAYKWIPARSQGQGHTGRQLHLVEDAGPAARSLPTEFQHLLHHGPDPVVDVVELRLAHEGRGRDHLVLLVHVSFVHRSYGNASRSKD